MGTKNNPGAYDCYANADPDEPMFVLLGRDKYAPMLVRLWAEMRFLDGEEKAKVLEAHRCADDMERFRIIRRSNMSHSPKLASEMSDMEMQDDFTEHCHLFDEVFSNKDGREGTGSLGEWIVERLDELRTEAKRRGLTLVKPLAAAGQE